MADAPNQELIPEKAFIGLVAENSPQVPTRTVKTSPRSNLSVPEASQVDKEEIKDYIRQLWGSESKTALAVFECESGYNPRAINWNDAKITGMPSQGIAQLNRPLENRLLSDWQYNLNEAKRLYDKRGWKPWSCYAKV